MLCFVVALSKGGAKMKPALVFLFPHVGTVEDSLLSGLGLLMNRIGAGRTLEDVQKRPQLAAIAQGYLEFTGLLPRVANELRCICDKSYAVVAEGDNPKSEILPDFGAFDHHLVSGVSLMEDGRTWANQGYEIDWAAMASSVGEQHVVVAGFHFDDCVKKFANATMALGKYTLLCPWVSDYFHTSIATTRSLNVLMPFDVPLLCEPGFPDAKSRWAHLRALTQRQNNA